MPERDYSHIHISETDETELADMKLAYLTAARERDALEDEQEQLVSALHGLLFVQYHRWPLDQRTREIPFVKSTVLPVLPLVERFHEELHGGPTPPLQQATMTDRLAWMRKTRQELER